MTSSRLNRNRSEEKSAPSAAPRPKLSLGPLKDAIPFHLRLAQDASFQAFARRLGSTDLRPGRFALLLLIAENPGISANQISLANGRDKSTTSLALRDLVKGGLVTGTRATKDRRMVLLNLTKKGRAQLERMKAAARLHDAQLEAIVGKEKEQLLRMLRTIISALSNHAAGRNEHSESDDEVA